MVRVAPDRSRRRVFNPSLDDFCLLLRSLLMTVFALAVNLNDDVV
jgi:lipopolysaccharide/colanic/teichoic acid biosynthesis glycosyltransferase